MNIYLPLSPCRQLRKAKEENRGLRENNRDLRGEQRELIIELAVAQRKAEKEAARADALEKANDELRSDLSSWLDRAVSSDG